MVWLQAAQNGDKTAFGHLVSFHQERLLRVAYAVLGNRHDAEDVVQETFVKAYLVLDQLKDPSAFRRWLLRITVNKAINWRKKPARNWLELDKQTMLQSGESPEQRLESLERRNQLRLAMTQLTPQHRAVLVLREEEQLSYDEIAELLGIPVGTVRSRISYARQRLREAFLLIENSREGGGTT